LVLRETKLDTSQPQVIQVPVGIFVVSPEKVCLVFDDAVVPSGVFLDRLSLAKLAVRVRQRLLFRARLSRLFRMRHSVRYSDFGNVMTTGCTADTQKFPDVLSI